MKLKRVSVAALHDELRGQTHTKLTYWLAFMLTRTERKGNLSKTNGEWLQKDIDLGQRGQRDMSCCHVICQRCSGFKEISRFAWRKENRSGRQTDRQKHRQIKTGGNHDSRLVIMHGMSDGRTRKWLSLELNDRQSDRPSIVTQQDLFGESKRKKGIRRGLMINEAR